MAIKKLIKQQSPDTTIFVRKNEAVITFNHEGNKECLYLTSPIDSELEKLKEFSNAKDIKFVGDKSIHQRIEVLNLGLSSFTKTILVESETKLIFYSQTGRIRIEKKTSRQELSTHKKKKVLIIDDSKTIQKLLTKIVNQSSLLEVMAIADGPSQAQEILKKNTPDLITLDIHMPEMNGVEYLKKHLAAKNIPTVMISSVSINEGPLVMEALSSGAATYIEKPSLDKLDEAIDGILEKLESIASVKKIKFKTQEIKTNIQFKHLDGLIAIGSSTGGTQALQEVFTGLPDQIPPIVVVQHIPAVFSKALAERLNTLCKFTVKEAEDGEFLIRNTIYIAPGGRQMKLSRRGKETRVSITDDPPLNRFKPSVDYLFNSIAGFYKGPLVGAILTGMGRDGAQGLLQLRNIGAATIAQDEASSIVFGMPKEAIKIGAAEKIISLEKMSTSLVTSFNKLSKANAA